MEIKMNDSIDDITFDIQSFLSFKWEVEYPNGKLPDRIAYLLSEIRKEWRKH